MGHECLPRLLYWADLPVEPSQAGAIQMHRLLEEYPADKLLICAPRKLGTGTSAFGKRIDLPREPLEFLFRSRFAFHWMTILTLGKMLRRFSVRGRPPRFIFRAVNKFRPEAVVTVGVAGAWMGADALARRLKVPLHVIVHDDHHYASFWVSPLRGWGERLFGKTYRRATSRFCISLRMEREFRLRFGVSGQVLLPFRGCNSTWFDAPRFEYASRCATKVKVFYAGSLYGSAFQQLERIAEAISSNGHHLVAYTLSDPPADFHPKYLDLRSPISSSEELVIRLHEDADILLLLSNFDDRDALRTLFPSKMTDYTAAAVAILVIAPEDSAIAEYHSRCPHVGELITVNSTADIADKITSLAANPNRRQQLAEGAVRASREDFSYQKAFAQFCNSLSGLSA